MLNDVRKDGGDTKKRSSSIEDLPKLSYQKKKKKNNLRTLGKSWITRKKLFRANQVSRYFIDRSKSFLFDSCRLTPLTTVRSAVVTTISSCTISNAMCVRWLAQRNGRNKNVEKFDEQRIVRNIFSTSPDPPIPKSRAFPRGCRRIRLILQI